MKGDEYWSRGHIGHTRPLPAQLYQHTWGRWRQARGVPCEGGRGGVCARATGRAATTRLKGGALAKVQLCRARVCGGVGGGVGAEPKNVRRGRQARGSQCRRGWLHTPPPPRARAPTLVGTRCYVLGGTAPAMACHHADSRGVEREEMKRGGGGGGNSAASGPAAQPRGTRFMRRGSWAPSR